MMAMVISTNTASINAQRHLNASRQDLDVAMERLSSGQRINSAADDAAGLAIRDKMTSQVEGLNQAVRNANDAISFMQSAEGALEETTNILQRMRTLAVQAVNDTNSASDRANLNDEIGKLQEEITRIGNTSTFNNKNLIDGSMTKSVFQVGHVSGQTIEVGLNDMRSEALGSSTFASGAKFETKTLTVSGTVATGDTVKLVLGSTATEGSVGSITYTATADVTGTTALADIAQKASDAFGSQFTFSALNNVLTVTSKTAGVDGRFGMVESGVVAFANGASAVDEIVETVDGEEAVAIAQTTTMGITGALKSGSTVTLTLVARGPDKDAATTGVGSTDNVSTTVTHTAAADMTGAEVAAALAGKISSGYSFTTEGNTLNITTKTGGNAGSFTAAITENDTLVTAGGSQLQDETKITTAAKDGGAAPTDVTISQIAVTDRTKAADAITIIDNALKSVGQERAKLGAFQNRLTHAVNNMTNMSANTAAARSVVADADYAAESSSLAKNQILQQAGTAMLAQANAQAQSVLSLLK
jgi:flagellin